LFSTDKGLEPLVLSSSDMRTYFIAFKLALPELATIKADAMVTVLKVMGIYLSTKQLLHHSGRELTVDSTIKNIDDIYIDVSLI
jgi:hypothetical protein